MPYRKIYRLSATAVGFLVRISVFLSIVIAFYLLYKLLLEQALDGSKQIIPIFFLWVISAYIVVPRIHRFLSKYYLPSYFVGRIRSPSGFLADPVNLAFFGSQKAIHKAMQDAGWKQAEPLTPRTFVKVAYSSFLRKSYPSAPVGDMFLFNRKFDFAYQQEVDGSPNERHHVRFWKTPKSWRLPGGHEADWLAAATYDTHVGIKVATGQIDHFIHEDVDEERDYIVKSLKETGKVKNIEIVENFTNAYHDRNNGGDRIKTDGSLPFIHL
jgi:hypothetical protein